MKNRLEQDSIGTIEVPGDRLWGAQTERSRQNFRIGDELMPLQVIYSLAILKKTCAMVNREFGRLDAQTADVIALVCEEIRTGKLDQEFPLSVWQTGSGTHSNMNVNEVIANRATALIMENNTGIGPIHPNDHVNMSQSSNDVFPAAMHIATVLSIEEGLLPSLAAIQATLETKAVAFQDIIKIGRTHLQDATPLSLGQEISGWAAMLNNNQQQLKDILKHLRVLAIGGTAVGTGLNAPPGFGDRVAALVSRETGTEFLSAANKFQALAGHDALVLCSGALKALAANLMKIGNDIRWLASGPRCGIGEITIPANEPGSSIMPGKVNPSQVEALTMVACQVFGNDTTVGFAASQGNFELNVFKPVIIYNILQATTLLTDAMASLNTHCAAGIEPVRSTLSDHLHQSLMLVTALTPHLGYDKAAQIAKKAHADNCSLREAALCLEYLTGDDFDRLVRPENMIGR